MHPIHTPIDRATFLNRVGGLLAVAVVGRLRIPRFMGASGALEHPEPREGITAERVLSVEALAKFKEKRHVMEAYEFARAYPATFDGIACACSCGSKGGAHRSLLVCFESLQPTGCGSCQEEGGLVGTLAKEGKTLVEIRQAVDKQFD